MSFDFNQSMLRQPTTPIHAPQQSTPVHAHHNLSPLKQMNHLSPIQLNQSNQGRNLDISMQAPQSPFFNQSLLRSPSTPFRQQTPNISMQSPDSPKFNQSLLRHPGSPPQAMQLSPPQNLNQDLNQSVQMDFVNQQPFQQQHVPPAQVAQPSRGRPRGRPRGSRSSSRGSAHNFSRYHRPENVRTHPYETKSGRVSRPPKRYGYDD